MASKANLRLLLVLVLSLNANAQSNLSNVIPPASSLSPGENRTSWLSPSGLFAFGFYPQGDGFAIGIWLINQTGKIIIWTANRDDPSTSSNATLEFTKDGNSSYPDKNNGAVIHRATLDADGIFRLYSHHFERSDNSSSISTEWRALPNQCYVKGFCGLNSYCSFMGEKAECMCFPGFRFFNDGNKFLGCYRNFNNNDCRRTGTEDRVMLYSIVPVHHVSWTDHPYFIVISMKEGDCRDSCLIDCNCGAVLYRNNSCSKHKLPLRYGLLQSDQSQPTTAFFKVTRENIRFESKRGLLLILATSLGFISCLCFLFAVCCFCRYRNQFRTYRLLSENVNLGLNEEFTLRSFSYKELEKATNGFKEELGKGTFGALYKGTMHGGNKTIAVRRLEKVVEEGQREFRAEMTAIGQTHHRNLVQLLGFCIEGSRKLLVYEYMPNGSLADLLFKAEIRPIWKERVKIALDVARGILYLHEGCEVHIIHCNIKPQNILMDDTWTAKISDFGLAKLYLLPNQSRKTTGGKQTTGYSYFAPEWQKNALISAKADTYSFGILVLEIVCCRRSIEVNVPTADEISLSSWVYNCFVVGELDKLVEADENVDFKTLERMVKVGLWCIQEDPALRPSMKSVILMLEGTIDIPVPPSLSASLDASRKAL
ncbi:G-type lectin S-receptor-like serine/threonine-protein kinase LECRK1 isoform X2 [Juglans microcarpa x Juglans regia]|uniref:G-type lectin S-receptor-like serine/threonine-protein kinase LECRK1 isoform X2 n=1 Tax=Juglans microcarpa x Juglans regia TaxID=2249226 RepID=UPI001B7EBA28|nr:G-type lectin S-receptor-like serine/threonine-protein kinase LECRK1 isoform X2 [Juglans microcarpa x Juglans regia]